MKYPLFFVPSLFVLVLSIFLGVGAVHPLVVWLSMVLNLVSMVGLFSGANSLGQGVMLYFLVQSISSTVFLIPATLKAANVYLWEDLMVFGLLIKMGVAPFHFWVMPVFYTTDWVIIFLLSGVQKILPLSILSALGEVKSLVLIFSAFSVLLGGFGAIKSVSLKGLFAFSSVSHGGWMAVLSSYSCWSAMYYVGVYSLTLVPVTVTFMVLRPKSVVLTKHLTRVDVMRLIMALGSLSGLPPFMGFLGKLLVWLEASGSLEESLVLIPFFLGSCLNLFAYLILLLKVSLTLLEPKSMLFKPARWSKKWWGSVFVDVVVVSVLVLVPIAMMVMTFL